MSKKTIAFTMPAAGRGPRERAPVILDGVTGERVPFAADESSLRAAEGDSKTDEWVRDRPSPDAVEPAPDIARLRGFAVGASVTINLAAERDLTETMMLSLVVPFALGWFWFANAMARRQQLWGL